MIEQFVDWFGTAQGWLFETVIEPLIYASGAGAYIEDAFEGYISQARESGYTVLLGKA